MDQRGFPLKKWPANLHITAITSFTADWSFLLKIIDPIVNQILGHLNYIMDGWIDRFVCLFESH